MHRACYACTTSHFEISKISHAIHMMESDVLIAYRFSEGALQQDEPLVAQLL